MANDNSRKFKQNQTMSVSYTHLDVYKRQLTIQYVLGTLIRFYYSEKKAVGRMSLFSNEEDIDVYKRQCMQKVSVT